MNRQINHKTMRVIVGLIALLLSPVVYLASGIGEHLTSISISYWTDSQDIFVGSLIAVGFFLSAYNGAGKERDLEYYLSRVACVFAICVAIFPTKGFDKTDQISVLVKLGEPARWVSSLTDIIGIAPQHVHYVSAILLFVCLIIMMWFFSKRAASKGKTGRARTYLVISALMVIGMIGIYLYGNAKELEDTTFWVEVWGLTLFGVGWLTAGSYRSEE